MSRVYWDSMLFVYLFEGNPAYAPRVKSILEAMLKRRDTLCTSVFTLGEVLAGARKFGSKAAIDATRRFFLESGQVELLPFSATTSDTYGVIRATTNVTSADAIHLACASESSVDLFITNDKKLKNIPIPGIPFIVGLDTNLY
jgi:predicted nucleic acid-binding protein